MTRIRTLLLVLAVALPSLAPLPAAASGTPETHALEMKDVWVVQLENGMTWLLLERHESPVFSAVIGFKVGSVDERPGITGLSHLLEHMLFKGTTLFGTANYEAEMGYLRRVDGIYHAIREEEERLRRERKEPYPWAPLESPTLRVMHEELRATQKEQEKLLVKNELWETYLARGGTGLNASTSNDFTTYYVSLPANQLEAWALLESDRYIRPVFREFYSERDVVYEERRMRIENDPDGKMEEQLYAAAFTGHPYGIPVVGWPSDLSTMTREECEAWFKTYYAPGNAVGVLVGDFDAEATTALLRKYFGEIPRGAPRPAMETREPVQTGRRTVEVEFDAEPAILVGYHIPPAVHPDTPAIAVLGRILSSGKTSRLYRNLVLGAKLATEASAGGEGQRYGELFTFSARPRGGHTTAELLAAWEDEVRAIAEKGVEEWELEKVQNQIESEYVHSLDSVRGLAFRLARTQLLWGDWTEMLRWSGKIRAVKAEDVQRVTRTYLTRPNSTVVTLVHAHGTEGGAR